MKLKKQKAILYLLKKVIKKLKLPARIVCDSLDLDYLYVKKWLIQEAIKGNLSN